MANPPPTETADEPKTTQFHTVFVDTNLNTHIAMAVEEFDTVADFKKKIQREHVLCFPDIGEIGVNVLQVKRRGFLYHLADSMYVRNVFEGVKGRWFVYVDASVKLGLENYVPGNGILRLEHNVMEDRMDQRVNEADKYVRNVHKDESLNGKASGDAVSNAVMKVIEDLEIDFEHMGDDNCRTSSCDTNKRVETGGDGGNIPNGVSGQVRKSGKKRKMDESENPIGRDLLKGDFSSGLENESTTAKKRRKSEKNDKSYSKPSSTKTNKSTVDASVAGAQNGDTVKLANVTNICVNQTAADMICDSDLDGHKALHYVPTADGRLESENVQINVDHVKDKSRVNHLLIVPTNGLSNGEGVLHPGLTIEDSSMAKTTVDGPDLAAAFVSEVPTEKSEPRTKPKKKKKTKSETLLSQLPSSVLVLGESNDRRTGLQCTDSANNPNLKISETHNIEDALCEKQFSTCQSHVNPLPIGPNNVLKNGEDSSMAITMVDGPDPTSASVVAVPTEKSEPSTKHKKKKKKRKTKSQTLLNQLPWEVPVPAENNDRKTGLQSTDSVDIANLKVSETKNIEDALCQKKLTIGQTSSIDKSTLLPESREKMSLENKKPADPREEDHVLEAHEVLHSDGDQATLKSEKTAKSKRKQKDGYRNNKAKSVTEGVEATQCDIFSSQSAENIGSKPETTNIADLGLIKETDGGRVMDNVICTDRSDLVKEPEVNPGAVEDGKKSHVGSSQDSLSMCQPHGAVVHSDTESFRVLKELSTSTGGKQKSKSKDKKSKQISSEGVLNSPSIGQTLKPNVSHETAKLNTIQFKAMAQHQSKENSETFTASNSTLKSPVGVQRTKYKKLASKKSATSKVNKTEISANRRKTLLSANIFKDDNSESSEDEEAVTSLHSAGTFLEDTNVSDVSETEDDTGFSTPVTVAQRKAAEVENDSSQNKYTLEKLRESACLEKAKRAQELGIPLEDFVPDSQAEVELIE